MPEINVLPNLSAAPTPANSGNPSSDQSSSATDPGNFASELHRQISAAGQAATAANSDSKPTASQAVAKPPASNAAPEPAKKTAAADTTTIDPGALGLAALVVTSIQPSAVNAPGGTVNSGASAEKKAAAPAADSGLLPLPISLPTATADAAIGKNAAVATTKTAIPAALATADESLPAVHAKQADAAVPESAFQNLLATAQVTAQNHGSSPVAPLPIQAPFGSSGWESNVGDKLVWMAGSQTQHAELVLNPPHLGRVEVSLSLHGDQASAQFVSHNPLVRDALEAAMPRLREMLADAGVSLGQAQVGSGAAGNAGGQSPNHQGNGDNSSRSQAVLGQGGSALRQINASSPWLKQGNSLVDVFA